MDRYSKKTTGFIPNLKRAFAEKDILALAALLSGILNIVLSIIIVFTGFTHGWLSIGLGFVIGIYSMYSLDKTRNSIAIAGAICGFVGTAFGLIYLFCVAL